MKSNKKKKIQPLIENWYEWERKTLEDKWDLMAQRIDEIIKYINENEE